jgi:hypothetical protein
MNHASGAVAPPDTEVIQVGNAVWRRAKRRGLVQGAVRAVRVVEFSDRPAVCPGRPARLLLTA